MKIISAVTFFNPTKFLKLFLIVTLHILMSILDSQM